MCVRYTGSISEQSKNEIECLALKDSGVLDQPSTWVGHCIITHIALDHQSQMYSMIMRLHQSTTALPQQILNDSSQSATIEWIQKASADRQAPVMFDARGFSYSKLLKS
jgi:hypothetical protein